MSSDLQGQKVQPNRYDFSHFLLQTQLSYYEIKRQSTQQTQKNKNYLNEKFSLTFQQKFKELSEKFDSVTEKAQIKFDHHRLGLQDEQETIDWLIKEMSKISQFNFIHLVARFLVKSEAIYQKWIKQEILTLKEELQMVILKNCNMQTEIIQAYQEYDKIKQTLDEQMNYRQELEKHFINLEKQLSSVKEENDHLKISNECLQASKQYLNEEVESTKIAQKNSSKSELIQKDRLKEQIKKNSELLKDNQLLTQKILHLEGQLQQFQNQRQNLNQQIRDLSKIVDYQADQIELLKNQNFRQIPTTSLKSYDKLHNYQHLIEGIQRTSELGSPRGFFLSNQSSMGKLTIFENRHSEDRLFEKLSNADFSLRSFEIVQESQIKLSQNKQNFNFQSFNQVTFRPQVDQAENQLKEYFQTKLPQENSLQLIEGVNQQTKQKSDQQNSIRLIQQQGEQTLIQPLNISSAKSPIQRVYSTTQFHRSISKKLIFKELNQKQINNYNNQKDSSLRKGNSQQKKRSQCGYSQSYINQNRSGFSRKFQDSRKNLNFKTQHKNSIQNLKQATLDNKSQANSVNQALIKKSFRLQKQYKKLQQKLSKAQNKLQQYEELIRELENQIKYNKKEFLKFAENNIRYKSEIQSSKALIEILQDNRSQVVILLQQKDSQIQQYQRENICLNQKISQLSLTIDEQKNIFEGRLLKVKEFCKVYVQQKHQVDIDNLTSIYQHQIKDLEQNLRFKNIKPLLIDVSAETEKKRLSLFSCFQQNILYSNAKYYQSTQTEQIIIRSKNYSLQTETLNLKLTINSAVQETINPNLQNKKSLNKKLELHSLISQVFCRQKQAKEYKHQLSNVLSQKIHNSRIKSSLKFLITKQISEKVERQKQEKKRQSHKLDFISIHIQDTEFKNIKNQNKFSIRNVISQTINQNGKNKKLNKFSYQRVYEVQECLKILQKERNKKLSLSSCYSLEIKKKNNVNKFSYHRVYDEKQEGDTKLKPKNTKFRLTTSYQLQVLQQKKIKSPYFQKKQLLDTPSSICSLQTNKQTTMSSKHQNSNKSSNQCSIYQLNQEQSVGERQRQSVGERQKQSVGERQRQSVGERQRQSVEESFQSLEQNQNGNDSSGPESFFTCIRFKNQSFTADRNSRILDKSINLQNPNQENFVANKQISKQGDILDCIQTSQVLESINENVPLKHRLHGQKISSLLDQIIKSYKVNHLKGDVNHFKGDVNHFKGEVNHFKGEVNHFKGEVNHFKEDVNHLKGEVNQFKEVSQKLVSQAPTKHHKIKKERYFQILFPNQKIEAKEQKFYSKFFQKHLQAYFRKETNLTFSSQVFPKGYLPNLQKIYLFHVESNKEFHVEQNKNRRQNKAMKYQRFLLYKKLLINLETEKKLQIPKSQMFKFLLDDNKTVLGNFQIVISTDSQLKIMRKNKRCFYFGQLEDGVWPILRIQQINISYPLQKR